MTTSLALPHHSRELIAGVLADRASGLAIAAAGGSGDWIVSHSDSAGVAALAPLLGQAYAEHGPPSVIVEPARPSRPEDRAACGEIMSALGSIGIRALDGDVERTARREAADRAVTDGMDGTRAREIVDRMDADFTLRVGASQRASSSPAYQIVMHSADAQVTLHLTRIGGIEAGAIPAIFASARSTSADAAGRQALHAALADAAAAAASAVCSQWVGALDGSTPCTVELIGASGDCLDEIRKSQPELRVLEHRTGVRSVLQVPAHAARALAESVDGASLEHSRPGYIRMICTSTAPGRWMQWLALGGAGVAAAVGWALRRREIASRGRARGTEGAAE